MAEPQASESVAGPLYELVSEATTLTRDAAAAASGVSISDTYQTYLDVSAAAHPVYGAEGVYFNGRGYREHSSPRIGTRNRDSSAERCTGTGNPPCGIMKVSECHHLLTEDFQSSAALKMSTAGNTLCSSSITFLTVL